jgi:hypothetical protein
MKSGYRNLVCGVLAGGVVVASGCHSIGPSTVARDRFDYSEAISDSWKRQTLLNIVKLRYDDPPIFVDVGQIVSGYTLQSTGSVGGTVQSAANGSNGLALGAEVSYTDRPTITYTPLTGNKFIRTIVTPIPPAALFSAIQAGFPADAIMLAGVASINGLKNQQKSGTVNAGANSKFLRVVELMRKIQLADGVGMRVEGDTPKTEAALVLFHMQSMTPETAADVAELHQLLGLAPDAKEVKLVFGSGPANDHELAVTTRSMIHIMANMAAQADVPPEDQAAGRVNPAWDAGANGADRPRLIHIYCSDTEPKDAFAEVHYRNHWFWISDTDLKSKHMFSLIMLLFTLGDNSEPSSPPVLTIPTQ